VNEAFDENGEIWNDELNQVTKKTDVNVWKLHLGPDYIARAFVYAHEADPNAVLFYNEFGQERMPKKLQAIVNMVNDFKARHIPIGGVGLQMHLTIKQPLAGIDNALEKLSATGVQVRISELDIRINLTYKAHDPDSLQNVAKQKNMFYAVARDYSRIVPKDQQYGITFWCVTDKDTYINVGADKRGYWESPLLFDVNYKRKPAYAAFIAGLRDGSK
jgi:endo-1,4-beta-xylanase